MRTLITYAWKHEVEEFFKKNNADVTCEQADTDVFVEHQSDIFPLLLEEGRKAWNMEEVELRFDTSYTPHSEDNIHPLKSAKGYYSARNYRIRNSLGPAF